MSSSILPPRDFCGLEPAGRQIGRISPTETPCSLRLNGGVIILFFVFNFREGIAFQIVNRGLLRRDQPVYHVANRKNSDEIASFQNWKMAHVPVGHNPHALCNILARVNGYELLSHYVTHWSILGGCSFEDDFSGVIALGNNSD